MKITFYIFLLLISFVTTSCQKETTPKDDFLPVVFLHGLLGSGDSYEWMAKRFTSNGYPSEKIFTYDWNTINGKTTSILPLNSYIQKVLQITGQSKVHLVGHSLGGGLVFNYCMDTNLVKQIASVSMLAPYIVDRTGFPSDKLPTLNIWPDTDYVVTNGDSIVGAKNIVVPNKDHNEIAACNESFKEIFYLITGKFPATVNLTEEAAPEISGKVVSFVENNSGAGAKVEVYEVEPVSGYRKSTTPVAVFNVKLDNTWGPLTINPKVYYEFKVSTGKIGDRTLHYYREPFTHSDNLVYLRLYPQPGSFLNIILSGLIPVSVNNSVGIFYSASKAIWNGRDELSVNGKTLNSPMISDPELNTVAMFLYDANNNRQSDFTSVPLFDAGQSLKGVDFYMPSTPAQSIQYNFNGRILNTPNWSSSNDGIGVVVYE